ncbi:guanylate cyclase domain-containing protein [Haematococcus lacustris]|uniref:Guanylate cyclase domain-containing protein n=1 Tax=Haematococcus lacustris TaxID=44745 RepID=A0A699ZKP1_HAELA|nr:guanylate cyclase domain-containing protein [Haematococcus lacustris]
MATWHPNVSVLFADIVGFSTVSQEVEPEQVFAMLNELYARYDSICETMPSLYKASIETIGDAYMVAAGLLLHDADHAATMLRFALAMQQAAGQVQMPTGTGPVRIRVGIHSGPVTSGIIGKIRKRYCLVGNTVNTASRMESCGLPGRIHVSSSTHQLVAGSHPEFVWECRGPLDIKGLGSMVTWVLAQPEQA